MSDTLDAMRAARLRTARSYREIRRINGHAMARLVWRRARDSRRELEREIAQMVLKISTSDACNWPSPHMRAR